MAAPTPSIIVINVAKEHEHDILNLTGQHLEFDTSTLVGTKQESCFVCAMFCVVNCILM